MGGVGTRLGCESFGISSKIFYITSCGMILDKITDCINEIEELSNIPIEFYLCDNNQYTDLQKFKSHIKHKYKIHKIDRNAHLFSVIQRGERALMIFGDTLFQQNIIKDVISSYKFNGFSTVTLLPTDSGIDNVDFVIQDHKIVSVISCKKQMYEPTQVFLFNSTTTEMVSDLVNKGVNRFDIMYKYILKKNVFNVVECFQNECININEESDLAKIGNA